MKRDRKICELVQSSYWGGSDSKKKVESDFGLPQISNWH
jgi:hypothetical protein